MRAEPRPDLGDLMIVMLAGTLAGVRDRLRSDGFEAASDLVAIMVDVADDYLTGAVEPGAQNQGVSGIRWSHPAAGARPAVTGVDRTGD